MNTNPTLNTRPTGSYTIINHTARLSLHLSITEYCVFDLIDHLAINPKNNRGWCYASKETIAEYFALDRSTVFRIMKKGIAVGIVEKHAEQPGSLRTTRLWSEAMGISRWISQPDRRKMRLQPSQNATKKGRILRRNNNKDNNIYNNTVKKIFETKESLIPIGDILDHYQLPKKGTSLTAWQVEAQRLWKGLALPGLPSQPFYQFLKRAYTLGEQQRLLRAFSYCQDAEGVQDKERLFYWRYAYDPVIIHRERNHS